MNDDTIEIFECHFKWIVRICEDGQVTERVFDIAEHAHSWAAGQRIRMQIPIHQDSFRAGRAD